MSISNIDFNDFKDTVAFIQAVLDIAGAVDLEINEYSSTRTLGAEDKSNLAVMTGSGNFIIPSGVFTQGQAVALTKTIAGEVQIQAGSGVTILETQNPDIVPDKLSSVVAVRMNDSSPEEWALFGAGIGGIQDLLDGKANLAGSETQTFSVATATLPQHAIRLDQANLLGGVSHVDTWAINDIIELSNPIDTPDIVRVPSSFGYTSKGSSMSYSDGVFTFPTTGLWRVYTQLMFQLEGVASDWRVITNIQSIVNGNANNLTNSRGFITASENEQLSFLVLFSEAYINVTNESSIRCSFGAVSENANTRISFNTIGEGRGLRSYFKFERIGLSV